MQPNRLANYLAVDEVCDVWETNEFRTCKSQLSYQLQIDRVTHQTEIKRETSAREVSAEARAGNLQSSHQLIPDLFSHARNERI